MTFRYLVHFAFNKFNTDSIDGNCYIQYAIYFNGLILSAAYSAMAMTEPMG